MSDHQSTIPYQPRKKDVLRETYVSLIGWSIYFVLTIIYCISYEKFVFDRSPQLLADVVWFVNEWGLWVVLTPLVFGFLRQINDRHPIHTVKLPAVGASAFLITLIFRVCMDLLSGQTDTVIASILLHAPRYLFVTLAILLIWRLILNKKEPYEKADQTSADPNIDRESRSEQAPSESTLLVYKGNDKCLIDIKSIDYACASKNYVDLHSEENTYLIRSTIKKLEAFLPSHSFFRSHRSIIVKIDAIERIQLLASGSGKIILKSGTDVPISKSYASRLKNFKLSEKVVT